jgi:hypothetical protein
VSKPFLTTLPANAVPDAYIQTIIGAAQHLERDGAGVGGNDGEFPDLRGGATFDRAAKQGPIAIGH